LIVIVLGFLCVLLYAIVTVALSATAVSAILADSGYLAAALFILFLFLTAAVATYVLFAGPRLRSMGLDYRRMSHLPVKPIGFYFAETLAAFVDLWLVLVMPFLVGTIWGLHLYSGIATFFAATVIFGLFILLIGVINQFILYAVDCLFRFIGGRLTRFVGLVFIVLASLALLWPAQILKDSPAELLDSVKALLYQQKLFLSPMGLVADGISRVAAGKSADVYLLHVPALLGYIALFFFAGYALFKLSEKLKIERLRPAATERTVELLSGLDTLLGFLWRGRDKMPVLMAKELVYLMRSPRVAMFCVLGAAAAFLQLRGVSGETDKFALAFVLLVALSWAVILLSELQPYMFSYDEKAIRIYFFTPVNEKEMILSKNLSLLVIVLLFQLVVCGLGWFALPDMFSAEVIVGLLITVFYLYFVTAAASNYSTIMSPRKVPYSAILGRSFHRGVFVVCLFAAVLPVALHSLFSFDLRLVAASLCCIALAVYIISLKPLAKKLADNKEDFIHQLSA